MRKKISEFFNSKNNTNKAIIEIGNPILDSILKKGILEQIDTLDNKPDDFTIYVKTNGILEEKSLSDFYTLASADKYIVKEVGKSKSKHKN